MVTTLRNLLLATTILLAAPLVAVAQGDETPTVIELDSGDRIVVEVIGETEDEIFVRSDVLGEFAVPKARISSIVGPGREASDAPSAEEAEEAASDETDAEAAAAAEELERPGFFDNWAFSAEFGLNGSDGNTERLSLRAGLKAERDTEEMYSIGALSYAYATEDGEKSESRFLARARNDWKFTGSPWRAFVEGYADRDEFQDWDWEVAAHGGFGYAFVENDKTLLLGRFGAGASRQFGGENTDIRPEALLGVDFNHKFNERNAFESSATLYPRLDAFGEYRFVGRAAYSVVLNEKGNLSFKIGVEDRYDSEPGGDAKKNDIDYFALLVYSF